jgi:hypothetical protein
MYIYIARVYIYTYCYDYITYYLIREAYGPDSLTGPPVDFPTKLGRGIAVQGTEKK